MQEAIAHIAAIRKLCKFLAVYSSLVCQVEDSLAILLLCYLMTLEIGFTHHGEFLLVPQLLQSYIFEYVAVNRLTEAKFCPSIYRLKYLESIIIVLILLTMRVRNQHIRPIRILYIVIGSENLLKFAHLASLQLIDSHNDLAVDFDGFIMMCKFERVTVCIHKSFDFNLGFVHLDKGFFSILAHLLNLGSS